MSQLALLTSATELSQVASLLNFKASALSYVLYKLPAAQKYTAFQIPKRSGGMRTIQAPCPQLKILQHNLSNTLQNCLEEINAREKRNNSFSNGFTRNRSIIDNAAPHRTKRFVFNIDLRNFFGTINFGRVRGFFIKDRNFRLEPKIATILAQIACHNNELPQGSPCSPVISNLIGHVLDVHLVGLARRSGCTYSRYADDITFSTNKPEFPADIATRTEPSHQWEIGEELKRLIKLSGFDVNSEKTRMQYCDSRQEVTGLLVNKKVNIKPEYRRTVRAMVHRLFTTGEFHIPEVVDDGTGKASITMTPGEMSKLHGMLGFVDQIDLYNKKNRPSGSNNDNLSSKESIFRDFLFYREFYSCDKPVLLCEGKTDNVYLKHAIHALAAHFPSLASVNAKGEVTRNIRIFKYTDTSTGRILGINGGTAPLSGFMRTYADATSRFKAPGENNPLILVLDNDSGVKGKGKIFNAVKQICKVEMTGAEKFVHVAGNMYVTLTPLLPGGTDSMMEDLFDLNTKATIIDGKSFNPNNNLDSASHYGKHVFAQKVIAANPQSVDFGGFTQLLDNISAVIDAHKVKVSERQTAKAIN
ncbi:retron Ec67 family RNA-directed DNA polymerase/endonuclease [Burkholderia ubonensis]|uniref:retron Ec67 family RNA-directed DNA polymerase/endonuclease n=1 Tax=Burkholderia ubonensis TaxID=101571 RepID=UPI0009B3D03E|nr:retron Ec67 family RNA-directed DNA polymerase/endonuclease [Burkholderia ubonensis]